MARSPRVRKLSSSAALEEHVKRSARFDFLDQRLRNVDVEQVWASLESGLTLGEHRGRPEHVLKSIDEGENNLRRAGMILQVAIEELDEFEVHWRAAYSEWSIVAREALERAKKDGRHSGQITQEMVENWVAENLPDYTRWRDAQRSLERNKRLAEHMFKAWESRSASLRKQADLVERRRGYDPTISPRRERGKGDEEQ